VIRFSGNNSVIKEELEEAKIYDALSLYRYPQDLAVLILTEIKRTVRALIAGEIESGILLQPFGDAETRGQYIASLRALLSIIENFE
jgi:hypothetical protein